MQTIKKFVTSFIFIFLLSGCSNDAQLKPLSQNATILAYGDSLTYGTGTSRDNAYPAVLANLIKRKVINAGIPGELSKNGLKRLPALVEKYQPELLILCHGANDILRKKDMLAAKENIQQMINIANENNIQVVLIGVPEFGIFLSTHPIYLELAEENKLPIELGSLGDIIGNNNLKSDHVHPNTKGYQLLAEKIAQLLKQSGALQS